MNKIPLIKKGLEDQTGNTSLLSFMSETIDVSTYYPGRTEYDLTTHDSSVTTRSQQTISNREYSDKEVVLSKNGTRCVGVYISICIFNCLSTHILYTFDARLTYSKTAELSCTSFNLSNSNESNKLWKLYRECVRGYSKT